MACLVAFGVQAMTMSELREEDGGGKQGGRAADGGAGGGGRGMNDEARIEAVVKAMTTR